MDRIRILRSAIGWAGRHAVSLLVAVAALGVAAEFGPALAQSADLLLARALHIDGDVSTGATDRAVVIQGDDGVNYRTVSTDASGDLQVDVLSSVGAGSMTDDAAFTPGTSTITAVGGLFDDVSPDSVNEGDGGAFRMSARREAYVQIRDAAGNEPIEKLIVRAVKPRLLIVHARLIIFIEDKAKVLLTPPSNRTLHGALYRHRPNVFEA